MQLIKASFAHYLILFTFCFTASFILPNFCNHNLFLPQAFFVSGIILSNVHFSMYSIVPILLMNCVNSIQMWFFIFLYLFYILSFKLNISKKFFTQFTILIMVSVFAIIDFGFVFSVPFCYYLVVNVAMMNISWLK